MVKAEDLPERLGALLSRSDYVGKRFRWGECAPAAPLAESSEAAAWWLAHRIVRLRCGGSPHLYDQWRRNVEEGSEMTEVERRILRAQLTQNLGLPDAPGSDDHVEGLVAEHIWFALMQEFDGPLGFPVRVDEPSWSVTDNGADGIVVYRVGDALVFRLWEAKKHDAGNPVRDTVNRACRQLQDEGAMRYLARASKVAQEIEAEDPELALLYGHMSELWANGSPAAGIGITIATSTDADVDDCFGGLPNYFEHLTENGQREGLLTQIEDFPQFAKLVREVVWKGL